MTRRWHVLGAGAIGGMLACRLQRAGLDVRLLPSPTRPSGTRQLKVSDANGEHHHPLMIDEVGPISHLWVTTKAHQTVEAMTALDKRLLPDATVLVLQNGMGVHDRIRARWPSCALIAASTTEGVHRLTPDHLRQAGEGTTLLGPWEPRDVMACDTVMAEIGRLTPAPKRVEDIRERLWEKLVMNCAINPLTAILDCRNGELLAFEGIPGVMDALVSEVTAVMRAIGLQADTEALQARTHAVSRATASNVSSMCQDRRNGVTTEVDFINGEVVRKGLAHGVETPWNTAITEAVTAGIRTTPTGLQEWLSGRLGRLPS